MSSGDARSMREAAAAAARPQKLRRFEWFRVRNDFVDIPIWRVVARKTRVPLSGVIAVVLRLEALANKSEPRGCVADMNVAEFAASLDLRPEVVARIRVALEEPDVAWIDQETIVDFDQRNPDTVDATRRLKEAERQRRRRAKLKLGNEPAHAAATGPPGYPLSRDSTRDSVTSRTRSDQILKPPDEIGTGTLIRGPGDRSASYGETEDILDFGRAQLWLRTDGWRFVTERRRVMRSKADQLIERWLAETADLVALVRFLRAAIAANVAGEQFETLVHDQIDRHKRGAAQQSLPLMPVVIKRSSA